ncbi:hypothetical protein COB21_06180, partial [Candidatus Aerophobetes bacterium]
MLEQKVPVALIGASGLVGQMYTRLLESHPYFDLVYAPPTADLEKEGFAELIASYAPIVFSALKDTKIATDVEMNIARAGSLVISNSACWREDPLVPLIIPEINLSHLNLLTLQRKHYGLKGKGGIITKPNCTLASFLLPLFPLHQKFGLKSAMMVSFQATSGMGKDFALNSNVL